MLIPAVAVAAFLTVFAGAPPAAQVQSPPATAAGAQVDAPSTTVRVRGIIDGYDTASRVLSLTTETGPARFPVTPTSRIRHFGKKIDPNELQGLKGYRAAVRYSDSGGHRTVESVSVFGKEERTER